MHAGRWPFALSCVWMLCQCDTYRSGSRWFVAFIFLFRSDAIIACMKIEYIYRTRLRVHVAALFLFTSLSNQLFAQYCNIGNESNCLHLIMNGVERKILQTLLFVVCWLFWRIFLSLFFSATRSCSDYYNDYNCVCGNCSSETFRSIIYLFALSLHVIQKFSGSLSLTSTQFVLSSHRVAGVTWENPSARLITIDHYRVWKWAV